MIIVTGGAGFIGSVLLWKLNEIGVKDILVVDSLGQGSKWKNLAKRTFTTVLHKDDFGAWLAEDGTRADIEAVFHLGASSSTAQTDVDYLMRNNLNYSIRLWEFCAQYEVPLIYASSGATYGGGEQGFSDSAAIVPKLRATNPYGFSKQKFDHWALAQTRCPPFWAGLKFFNVYGPQEYHKGTQSSVIRQFVPQVKQSGIIRLFKSYRPGVEDGDQRRDFVSVKDCVEVMVHLLRNIGRAESGLYNVGSGKARTFADLARCVFTAMGVDPARLEYIEMPEVLREHYQYHTEAPLNRLRERAGYTKPMTNLEDGVTDYVRNYLLADDAFL